MAKRGRRPKVTADPRDENPQMSLMPEHEFDYVDVAVGRVITAYMAHRNMNPDGKPMFLAFSGGKDSICLFFVCKRAAEELGMPMETIFDVQYNITNVDPPELVRFIREFKRSYPFITMVQPKRTMWELIVRMQMPPTRIARYCCVALKESASPKGCYSLTGVRRAESGRRSSRKGFEGRGETKKERILLNDNGPDRRWDEYCKQENAYICNPIIDWTDEDVWNFIRHNNLPYCSLYDEGIKRIGCIGCPMGTTAQREAQFERWPKYADCYKRAFQRMVDAEKEKGKSKWKDGEDAFNWWIYGEHKTAEQEETLFPEDLK